jgi:hypothetical protein
MTIYEIPLAAAPQQLQINLVGIDYIFTIYWCWPAQCWMFDLQIASTLAYLLQGQPLVTGSNLLAQYAYLNIGVALVVQTDNAPMTMPTFTNLGQQSHLYFVTEP